MGAVEWMLRSRRPWRSHTSVCMSTRKREEYGNIGSSFCRASLTASLLVLVAAMAFNWWSGLIRCIGAVALWGPFLVLTVVLLRAPKLSEEGGTVNQTAPKMEAESHLDKTVADEPARAERHDVHHHAMRILRYLSVFLFAFSLTGLAHSGKRSDSNHRVRGRC